MRRYLVVANLTLGGPPLWDVIRERSQAGDCHFHVLVPASHDPFGGTWTDAEMRDKAAERLERALAKVRDLGGEADGEVGDARPVDAVLDALRGATYDEVIVSTLPAGVSRWLKVDLVSRIERAVAVPVTHVIGEPAHSG